MTPLHSAAATPATEQRKPAAEPHPVGAKPESAGEFDHSAAWPETGIRRSHRPAAVAAAAARHWATTAGPQRQLPSVRPLFCRDTWIAPCPRPPVPPPRPPPVSGHE